MASQLALLFVACVNYACAENAWSWESRAAPWALVGRANASATFEFTIGLEPNDFAALDRELKSISDPTSAQYGAWMSRERVEHFMQPRADDQGSALAWASSTGAICRAQLVALRCEGKVAQVEALLSIELGDWQHLELGTVVTRATSDAQLPAFVSLLLGVTDFPVPRRSPRATQAAKYYIMPSTLKTLYNIPSSLTGSANSTQCAVEFSEPAPEAADMKAFFAAVGQAPYTITSGHTIGTYKPGKEAFESSLDVQWLGATGEQTNKQSLALACTRLHSLALACTRLHARARAFARTHLHAHAPRTHERSLA
jgi:tripeptidyl-peptidase-1